MPRSARRLFRMHLEYVARSQFELSEPWPWERWTWLSSTLPPSVAPIAEPAAQPEADIE